MSKNEYNIAIIGAGASGLAAAVTAGRKKWNILLVEKESRCGKKLLATGNGRCNFTNVNCDDSFYHGTNPLFQHYANELYSPERNREFFESIGVMSLEEEKGKVYPYSLQGSAVLDMLRREVESYGVFVKESTEIKHLKKKGDTFILSGDQFKAEAKTVIVACGGMASPELGGSDGGYRLLQEMGHTITPIAPALTKIKTENDLTNALKGIKVRGRLSLVRDKNEVFASMGEILFTDYGISGPPVLDCSRYLCFEDPGDFRMEIDFIPEFSLQETIKLLYRRRDLLKNVALENFFTGFIQKKVGQLLLKRTLNKKLSVKAKELTNDDIFSLAMILKHLSLEVRGSLGFKQSQVTAGGILTDEFNPETMESRLVPGLFAAGEVLDIDGDCGGYNLQWAWASGQLAASNAVRKS